MFCNMCLRVADVFLLVEVMPSLFLPFQTAKRK